MITKQQALQQYKGATSKLLKIRDLEDGLSEKEKNILAEDRRAQQELVNARVDLEAALGTPGESAALERFHNAEVLAPLREKIAEPVREFMTSRADAANREYDRLRDHQKSAKGDLCAFHVEEMLAKIDRESITKDLHWAYALLCGSGRNVPDWGAWLAKVIPPPERADWNPVLVEATKAFEKVLEEAIK